MKQLIRTRTSVRRPVGRRRVRTIDPAIALELAVIADRRKDALDL